MSGVRNLYQGKFSLSGVSVPSKKKFSHGLPEANVQRSAPLKQTPEKERLAPWIPVVPSLPTSPNRGGSRVSETGLCQLCFSLLSAPPHMLKDFPPFSLWLGIWFVILAKSAGSPYRNRAIIGALLRLLLLYHVSLSLYLQRRRLMLLCLVAAAISAFSTTALAAPNYSCKIFLATTPISTQNVYLAITPPANQSAMTAFITSYTSQTSKNFMVSDHTNNGSSSSPQSMMMIDVNDRYQIYTELCTPSTFENGTDVVEFVVHGCVGFRFGVVVISLSDDKYHSFRVGFDHTYWNFGGNGSENNYVESAIAAGRSVLIYDALGSVPISCVFHQKKIFTSIYFFLLSLSALL